MIIPAMVAYIAICAHFTNTKDYDKCVDRMMKCAPISGYSLEEGSTVLRDCYRRLYTKDLIKGRDK